MPPSHFLCLPLLTTTSRPQLSHSLSHLRSLTAQHNISASAVRPLGVLHLTIGVMTLTPPQLDAALQLLRDTDLNKLLRWAGERPRTMLSSESEMDAGNTDASITDADSRRPKSLHRPISPPPPPSFSTPLTISLTGLSAFPDARKATVLHASPYDPTNRLYHFSLALRQNFIDAGLIVPEERPLVLHATVVNTVYSKRMGDSGRGQGKISIDARPLLQQFNGREAREDAQVSRIEVPKFVWAEDVVICGARICGMGARECDDAELGMEYQVLGEKRFGGI
jgi:activating signal cointegrator complex subunit 1